MLIKYFFIIYFYYLLSKEMNNKNTLVFCLFLKDYNKIYSLNKNLTPT